MTTSKWSVESPVDLGRELHGWIRDLYPLNRSLTGPGVRATLDWLDSVLDGVPVRHEVATGTPVLDWTIPDEWTVREAWIAGPDGRRVVDFANHTLHLVGYSTPYRGHLSLDQLRPHLHSLPDEPDLIPYRTSYYGATWGFCLPHRQLEALPEGDYEVLIDADLGPGSLSYADLLIPGRSDQEILVSAHICHPSLANDNLSGLAVSVALARRLLAQDARALSYRFVWAPGTIGALTWLARNREETAKVRGGLVLACLGTGDWHYKRSRPGDATVDRAVAHVLQHSGESFAVRDFIPWGYDERQYGSPGFNLAVGQFSATPHGEFAEYHTSADDPDLVDPERLGGAVQRLLETLEVLEGESRWRNLSPYGEPQLGRRGLYGSLGGSGGRDRELALLWVLNQSDGEASLLDIAERADIPFARVRWAAEELETAGLLERLG
jgi:aminopeptidase-like protein